MLPDFVEDLQFVECRFGVIIFAPLDFECKVLLAFIMLNEPYGGEMAPSQFLNHSVDVIELLPQCDWVIPIYSIIYIIFAF